MRLTTFATVLLALILSLPDAPRAQGRAGVPPDIKLVLLVAVDQFRYDYLTRFSRSIPAACRSCSREGRPSRRRISITTPPSPL